AALRLKQRCGMPFVATFDRLDRARRLQASDRFPAEQSRIEAQLAAGADRIITLDPRARERSIALYGVDADCIELIPPGVDTVSFRPGPRTARRHFGLRAAAFVTPQFT